MSKQDEQKEQQTSTAPAQDQKGQDQSYGAIVKRQFRKNKPAVWSLRFIIIIVIIGLSADFLANEKPLMCKYEGKTFFPVFREYIVDLGGSWPHPENCIKYLEGQVQ